MLLQVAIFHSFLWLSNIPLCVCICVCVCIYTYLYLLLSLETIRGQEGSGTASDLKYIPPTNMILGPF